jgi:hypothetical protein
MKGQEADTETRMPNFQMLFFNNIMNLLSNFVVVIS